MYILWESQQNCQVFSYSDQENEKSIKLSKSRMKVGHYYRYYWNTKKEDSKRILWVLVYQQSR